MRGGSLGYRSRVAEALDIEPTRITLLKSPYFLVKQTYSNGQTWSLHKDEINLPMIGHFPTKRLAKQAVSDPEALKYYEETLNKTLEVMVHYRNWEFLLLKLKT